MWIALIVAVGFFLLTQLMIPTQKAKAGTFDDFDFPRIDDGSPIYYIAGRVKVQSANLTWYGDFSSKPIKKKSGLFKKSVVGHRYFLGFQLCICLGPDVKLLKVWFGQEEPGFTGNLTGGSFTMKDENAFGGETGGGGYDLELTYYGGSGSQTADPYLQEHLERVPGWRGRRGRRRTRVRPRPSGGCPRPPAPRSTGRPRAWPEGRCPVPGCPGRRLSAHPADPSDRGAVHTIRSTALAWKSS